MNKEEIINQRKSLNPNYELAQNEIARLTKSGLKQEVLNLLFKESMENELTQREKIYQKLDTKLHIVNENHWLTQEQENHCQRLAKMGRWLIFGQSEQLKEIWQKIKQFFTFKELSRL